MELHCLVAFAHYISLLNKFVYSFNNGGCNGGTLDGAMKYVLTHGIPTEEEYGLYKANVSS